MSVPPELRPVSAFLQRAKELETTEPVIAYWCTLYAVQQGMGIPSSDGQVFLIGLMDQLESMKVKLADNELVLNEEAAAAYIENFALKVFSQADNEDRKGKITRQTARKFLAAGNFLELVSLFGEAPAEIKEKIKYAKWKAGSLAKAFREGTTPVPGPAGGLPVEPDTVSDEVVASSNVTSAEAKELEKELRELGEPLLPPVPGPPASNTRSTAPSIVESDQGGLAPAPQNPTDAFAALSRASTPGFEPSAPPPPPVDPDNGWGAPPSPPILSDTHQTSELPPPPSDSYTTHPTLFPTAVFPPSLPPVLPSSSPVHPASISAPAPPTAPSPAPLRPPVPAPAPIAPPRAVVPPAPAPAPVDQEQLEPAVVASIQKHAKWAVSALNYDDYHTARKELELALEMLGGRGR